MDKITDVVRAVPSLEYICLDVANGYSEAFVQFLREIRNSFPAHTIIVCYFILYSIVSVLNILYIVLSQICMHNRLET